ncbi:amidohydrolase family protein [Rhodoplanes serenus]|uniref:Amidohydrolase family protein n=1 Tax=Rhodoplanes serenus TaxID=200615 RepID=A0A9X4XKS7_9BRAD|nr:amidohydrolase family protein [Rhodoplanes serenus]MTW16962.1 amidohydrolase family protein [Rhodoplanes serenus]
MLETSAPTSLARPTAIDVHAHVVVPEVFAATRPHSLFARAEADPSLTETQRAAIAARNDAVVRRMADVGDRIAAMDAAGVAVQVLSPSLVHQCSDWLPPDAALALDRRTNDTIAALVATTPTRFVGLGSVPLQTPDRAAAELDRCVGTLGLKGVAIPTRVGDREIGDAGLRPFWAAAEALGAVVYVHPAGNPDPRLRPYMMWNSLGQSIEETFAIASLFYEGILDAFPGLRICISHGGGYMPFYTGRIARNYAEKPATRRNMTKPPADYLRMLHYDTCVYDARVLRHLVEVVGADRVLLGSDYPVGDPQPVAFVRDATFLTDDERTAVLAGNASRLYGIDIGP